MSSHGVEHLSGGLPASFPDGDTRSLSLRLSSLSMCSKRLEATGSEDLPFDSSILMASS